MDTIVTSCPRLHFLEDVEGLMPTNEYVEGGLFEHRKVSAPELANRTRKEGEMLHTRSVSLSSEQLGITGTLDVIEEKGGRAYPVEYKHGSGCRDEAGRPAVWDNDAVQLCAQGLLLEEELKVSVAEACEGVRGTFGPTVPPLCPGSGQGDRTERRVSEGKG